MDVFLFENNIPDGFQTTGETPLVLSSDQFKNGIKSVHWRYKAGDQLKINHPIDFRPFDVTSTSMARTAFASWIYNDNPVIDQMTFQFTKDGVVKTSFKMNMGFKGWRAVVIPFETDMDGKAEVGMNGVTIIPPASVEQGSIYFDEMALGMLVDPRWPHPDYQVPFVNPTVISRPNRHWSGLLVYDSWLREFDQQKQMPATPQELDAVKEIMERIDDDLLNFDHTVKRLPTKELRKKFNNFIVTVDGNERLKPIAIWRQLDIFREAQLEKKKMKLLEKSTVPLEVAGKYMLQLAIAFHKEKNEKIKNDLRATFLTFVGHMVEQGYVRGSSFGVMHHQGYLIKEWGKALFLMRDELGPLRELARGGLSWFSGQGSMFLDKKKNTGLNVDVMNTMLQGMLFSVLLQEDEQKQVAHLRVFADWMNYSMLNHKGLEGGIQRDGSFFHHRQHYVAYGNGGMNGLTPVVYFLKNTAFEMVDEAYNILRNAVLQTRILSNDIVIPLSLSGRHPDGKQKITLTPFNYLAKIETRNGKTNPESEIAAAYLRLMSQPSMRRKKANTPFKRKLEALGVEPEDIPVGSWVMNYSSLALHRRQDWLASARGYSRYLVGNEIYRNANHFGQYINFGHLEILPSDSKKRGFKEAGWDWNRWPGTTTIHLPFDKLAAHIIQEDKFSGHERMLLSSESYSGANQLLGENAMFAMKLRGHPRHDGSFRARKSFFFFDDRIIALGSGIKNTDQAHVTQTTLFQDHLDNAQNETAIGAKVLSGLKVDEEQDTGDGVYLLDTNHNAYILPAGQKIRILRQHQNSFENEHKHPTEGDFATALIDHGKAPDNAGYEYVVLVEGGAEKAAAFVEAMGNIETAAYVVLQRDDNAHIVKDRATGIMAYALFEASDNVTHGLVSSVDTPSQIMVKEDKDRVLLSVVDPDLGFYPDGDPAHIDENGDPRVGSIYSKDWATKDPAAKIVRLVLHGEWQKKDDNPVYRILSAQKGKTEIEMTSFASTPVQMSLGR
ncbi:chondroitinase family polysaccharide lyase [Paremcibacter congregatus]|uniref:chondroitinase family polysaccharide lyase n=1 Tax=Paremcibacter congregatus TaxID=2043170 RepID=UPI003A8D8AC3